MHAEEGSGPVAATLAEQGYALVEGVVPPAFVERLIEATDEIVAAERHLFPEGHGQNGRVLCAPAYGGAYLDLCDFDPLFAPMEAILGADSILYAMTTSVLDPGSAGPIDRYHVDLASDRPDGLAISALLVLDPFTAESGATEFVPGSHRWGPVPLEDERPGTIITANPGDVCYFDPRIHHRTTLNRSGTPRRAVPMQMIRPWMKQRLDIPQMLEGTAIDHLSDDAKRRLGITTAPPRSVAEFVARGAGRSYA